MGVSEFEDRNDMNANYSFWTTEDKRLQTRNRASGIHEIPSKGVCAIGVSKGDETVWCQKKKKEEGKKWLKVPQIWQKKIL